MTPRPSHHDDVSNNFYRLLLGPSMTYSCAVWEWPSVGLEAAQEAKYELVSCWERSGEGVCGLSPLR